MRNAQKIMHRMMRKEAIILADDLAPSETIQLDRSKVLAFVTRKGATNSHTAILARTMNIPALVCTPVEKDMGGKLAIVDGYKGCIMIEPEEEVLSAYREKQKAELRKKELMQELRGKKTETKSGKKVIVRTLDIGADKKVGYFNLDEEENPALGYRAIRICLEREELFKTQLRALYRASVYGAISIMVPMITSVWEVRRVKELLQEVKEELHIAGVTVGDVEFGIMIETPAAVMIADELAKEVDFFSIGSLRAGALTQRINTVISQSSYYQILVIITKKCTFMQNW